jgi:hypothetical protein
MISTFARLRQHPRKLQRARTVLEPPRTLVDNDVEFVKALIDISLVHKVLHVLLPSGKSCPQVDKAVPLATNAGLLE